MRFERWVSLAGNVIAPATAISALLFYFGYVSSRSQYEYFGLDVDTIGLTTQDFKTALSAQSTNGSLQVAPPITSGTTQAPAPTDSAPGPDTTTTPEATNASPGG